MKNFFYGVIEGFYGRQWSWQQRIDYAKFAHQFNFECYIYAPKGDPLLRTQWREQYDAHTFSQLKNLRDVYRQHGIQWGLGISPMGINAGLTVADLNDLTTKIEQLNTLDVDILCILFDDMEGAHDDLAANQLAVVELIQSVSNADHHIVCPSYYSFDPKLETVFGKMPEHYLSDLGQGLAADIDIFWTGNKVIAEQYTENDLLRITHIVGRKPIIWDNYPVNDGKITSQYLHLSPYQGRPWELSRWSAGHIVNPMNQSHLSQLVLSTLFELYTDKAQYSPADAWEKSLQGIGNDALANLLRHDASGFQSAGLDKLAEEDKRRKLAQYRAIQHPIAREVADWLAGDYAFDPNCLTD